MSYITIGVFSIRKRPKSMESIHKSYYFHKEAARKAHRGTINANYMFTVPIFPKLCPVYSTLEVSNVALRCVIEGVYLNVTCNFYDKLRSFARTSLKFSYSLCLQISVDLVSRSAQYWGVYVV